MIRLNHILDMVIIAVCLAMLCCALAGCANVNGNGQVHAANGEIRADNVQIRNDAGVIQADAQKLWTMVSEKAKPIIDEITKRAASITETTKRSDAATIKSDNGGDVMAKDGAKKDRKIAKLEDSIWMKIGHAIEWVAGGLALAGVGWFVFRLCTEGTILGAASMIGADAKRLLGRSPAPATANSFM